MRIVLLLGCALLLLSAGVFASTQGAGAIAGVWRTKTGGYLQIYRQDNHWVGRVVGSTHNTPRYDTENPNPSKRGRRLLGVILIRGLTYSGNGEYKNGRVYNPNNGKTYKTTAKMKGPDKLEIHGYIGISLFGKSQIWHRADPHNKNVHQNLLHQPATSASTT